MTGLRLVCAWDALEVARAIARPLGAEGYFVSIATGRTGLDDLANPDRAPERLIVVWSLDGASSPYVRRWLSAAGDTAPIEVEIAKNVAPLIENRKEPPLDFSNWRTADRGDPRWKALQDRVHVAVHGAPPPPSLRKVAAVMLGVVALGAIGAAAVLRVVEAGTQTASAAPTQLAQHIEPQAAPVEGMGGPLVAPATLDAPRFVKGRAVFARIMAVGPAPDIALSSPTLTPSQTFHNHSLFGDLLDSRRDQGQTP